MLRATSSACIILALLTLTGVANASHGKHAGSRRARRSTVWPAASSFFLASDPHVPLAVVVDGRVREAVSSASRSRSCGDRHRWAKIGSKWSALDAWGQVIGTFAVSALDPYDVTGCSELTFAPPPPKSLSHVLVSVDSAWRPSASVEWKPAAAEVQSFDALVAKTIPDTAVPPNEVATQCKSVEQRSRFFEVPGGGRFAVGTSNTGYLVAKLDQSWAALRTEVKPYHGPFSTLCYRPIAVFDMNGDGRPEIVLRWSEGTSWSDIVVGVDDKGKVQDVAVSPGGSTA